MHTIHMWPCINHISISVLTCVKWILSYEYLFYTKLYIPVWDKQDKVNALVADKCKKIYWIDGVFFYEMKKRGQILEIYGKQ